MSGTDKRDFVKKNAQWATASLVYAVGTIALVWACLLPGLMLVVRIRASAREIDP